MSLPKIRKSNQPNQSKIFRALEAFIDSLPIFLAVTLAVFSALAMILLILGQFNNIFIIPLALIIPGLVYWLLIKMRVIGPGRASKEKRFFNILALVFVVAWIFFNAYYSSQHVFVNRDPAIYSVTAAYLVDENDLIIDKPNIFGDEVKIENASAGFSQSQIKQDELYAQGAHLLPILLGLAGRIGGESFMLHFNAVFGGLALLLLYGFASVLARPKWAFMSMVVLALSLPMIIFSRDNYTEPLAAAFTLGALLVLYHAQKLKSISLWLLAGVTAGASVLTRVDGYLTILALMIFLIVYMLAADSKLEKLQKFKQSAAFIGGSFAVSLIGWMDITQLSSGYYNDLRHSILLQIYALSGVSIVGVLAVILYWQNKKIRLFWEIIKPRIGLLFAIAITTIAIILASRPFWFTGYQEVDVPLIRGLQAGVGDPVEGTRSYSEQTVNWLIWYLGPAAIFWSLIGLIYTSFISGKVKSMLLMPLFITLFLIGLLYLNKPNISPDQIWAARRFLPVVIPCLLVFGAISLSELDTKFKLRGRRAVFFNVFVFLIVLLPPLYISKPFLTERTFAEQYAQTKDICKSLPKNAVVLWAGNSYKNSIRTVEAFCDIPAAGIENLSTENLASISDNTRKSGYIPIILTTGDMKDLDLLEDFTLISNVIYKRVEISINTPPNTLDTVTNSIYAGEINTQGKINKLPTSKN
jgi:4-amino-4-deoxy-L-arabinose transferase-like glycosyltransferase